MAQIILEDGATGKEIREALNAMMAELYAGGPSPSGNDPRPFKVTASISISQAVAGVTLIPSEDIAADERIYVTSFLGYVNGSQPWIQDTGSGLYIIDVEDTEMVCLIRAIVFSANNVFHEHTQYVEPAPNYLRGEALPKAHGLRIMSDGGYMSGSPVVITVCGLILKDTSESGGGEM